MSAYPKSADVDKDLCKLACFGVLDGVKSLVEAGQAKAEAGGEDDDDETPPFDINVKDKGGMNAFAWASRNGHIKVAAYLAEKGADVDQASAADFDRCIRSEQDRAAVALLLGLNCDVSATDDNGCTVLHWSPRDEHHQPLDRKDADVTVKLARNSPVAQGLNVRL